MVAPVGLLGGEKIVGSAEQPQVIWFGAAAFSRGLAVVDLQPSLAAAAYAVGIQPAAAEAISLEHCPARGAGDVRGPRVGRRGLWPQLGL